jgi:hypothetical protein
MATITSPVSTLADLNSRLDPGGGIADVIEILSQDNEVLDDMLWVEGNLPTGYKTTIRTGLPTSAWRLLNYGVPRSKSKTAQITDVCGMLETYSLVDKDLVKLSGNPAAFRVSEDMAFIESLSQTMAQTIFYGNQSANPATFTGLSPRYSVSPADSNPPANAVNTILAPGASGSTNASIWLVCWGYKSVHGIYPKGSIAGLQYEDVTTPAPVLDALGNPYQGDQTHYKWDCGLTLRDWRWVVRCANIEISLLTKNPLSGGSGPDLLDLMSQMLYKVPALPRPASSIQTMVNARQGTPIAMTKPVFYCNRTIKSFIDRQAQNKPNMLLQQDQFAGMAVTNFRGVPIRNCDQLLNTEALVT